VSAVPSSSRMRKERRGVLRRASAASPSVGRGAASAREERAIAALSEFSAAGGAETGDGGGAPGIGDEAAASVGLKRRERRE
jgi:hypothetical protein